jgi:hypothetical protein
MSLYSPSLQTRLPLHCLRHSLESPINAQPAALTTMTRSPDVKQQRCPPLRNLHEAPDAAMENMLAKPQPSQCNDRYVIPCVREPQNLQQSPNRQPSQRLPLQQHLSQQQPSTQRRPIAGSSLDVEGRKQQPSIQPLQQQQCLQKQQQPQYCQRTCSQDTAQRQAQSLVQETSQRPSLYPAQDSSQQRRQEFQSLCQHQHFEQESEKLRKGGGDQLSLAAHEGSVMPTTLQLGSGLPMLPSKLDANPSSIWHCEPLRCPLPSSSLCLGSRQQYAIPSADPRISHLGRHASLAVPPLLLHLPRNGQHSGSSELKMGFGKSASAPLSSHQYMSVSNPDNPELVLDTNISRRSHAHQQVERLQGPHEGHPSSAKLDGDSDNEIVASGSIYGLVECTTVLGDDREGVVVPTSSSSGVLLRPQVQTSLSPTNQKRDDADPCRDQDLSQGKYGHRTHELMKDVTDDVRAVEPTHAAAHMTMPRDNLGVIDVDALSDVQVEVVDIDTQVAPVDMDNPIGASSLRGCPLLKKSSSEVSPTSPVCSTLAPQRPLLMRRASPSQAQPPQPMPSAQRQVSLSYSSLEQSKSSPRPQVSQPSRSPLSRRDMSPLHQAISPSTSKAQQISLHRLEHLCHIVRCYQHRSPYHHPTPLCNLPPL